MRVHDQKLVILLYVLVLTSRDRCEVVTTWLKHNTIYIVLLRLTGVL